MKHDNARACAFFGHWDCPGDLRPMLREKLMDLIENHGVEMFYVGRRGGFDAMARSVLRELEELYPRVSYAIVLECPPASWEGEDFAKTLLPEGFEKVQPRYAVSWRSRWMLEHAGCVVSYITRSRGCVAQFAEEAKRLGKTVINLAELTDVSAKVCNNTSSLCYSRSQ